MVSMWTRSGSPSLAERGPGRAVRARPHRARGDPRSRRRRSGAPPGQHGTTTGGARTDASCSAPPGRHVEWPVVSDAALQPLTIVEIQRRVGEELDRIGSVIDELGTLFTDAGEELALVGGPVRDAMIGRLQNDLDFTTSARPDVTERLRLRLGRRRVGHGPRLRHDRLPQGTVAGRDHHLPLRDATTPPRASPTSTSATRSRATSVVATSRVNSMAVRVPGREFVDPFGGIVDLAERVLRTPGTPEDSFSDDPLRMMRAARFAAQLGFAVAPEVVAAMTAMAGRIEIISAERVRDELVKLVCAPHPRLGLTLLVETGLASYVLPELPALALERDEHHRHKDVYEHTLTVLEQSIDLEHRLRRRPRLRRPLRRAHARRRQAADPALRDRRRRDVPPPRRRRGQADPQADEGAALLQRTTSTRSRAWSSCTCASTATAPGSGPTPPYAATSATPATSSSGCTSSPAPTAPPATSARPTGCAGRTTSSRSGSPGSSEEEELDSIRPDLDGNPIMEVLGIGPGREVGEAYAFLLELRMDEGPMTPEEAEAALRAWWAARS